MLTGLTQTVSGERDLGELGFVVGVMREVLSLPLMIDYMIVLMSLSAG